MCKYNVIKRNELLTSGTINISNIVLHWNCSEYHITKLKTCKLTKWTSWIPLKTILSRIWKLVSATLPRYVDRPTCKEFISFYDIVFTHTGAQHDFHIIWHLCWLAATWHVPLVEQDILTLLTHLGSPSNFTDGLFLLNL
jgi:hypothetical protein